jgi:hypothetical protein
MGLNHGSLELFLHVLKIWIGSGSTTSRADPNLVTI